MFFELPIFWFCRSKLVITFYYIKENLQEKYHFFHEKKSRENTKEVKCLLKCSFPEVNFNTFSFYQLNAEMHPGNVRISHKNLQFPFNFVRSRLSSTYLKSAFTLRISPSCPQIKEVPKGLFKQNKIFPSLYLYLHFYIYI